MQSSYHLMTIFHLLTLPHHDIFKLRKNDYYRYLHAIIIELLEKSVS
jgi:hypothetical protein